MGLRSGARVWWCDRADSEKTVDLLVTVVVNAVAVRPHRCAVRTCTQLGGAGGAMRCAFCTWY